MRFIDNTLIEAHDGWEERSLQAKQALLNGQIKADDRSDIWRDIKNTLSDLSNNRCWYCETDIPRNDNAVDHYRPKGRVKGVRLHNDGVTIEPYEIQPEHLGYKWAAYKIENFRYSCQHCNEWRKDLRGTAGGKSSYFPLINEGDRAYIELNQDNEIPALLDPCEVLDWRKLSFDKSGKPFSRFAAGTEDDIKVRLSIRIYHLDQKDLNSSRAAQWALVKPLIDDAKKYFLKKLRGDQGASTAFNRELKKVKTWFNPKSKAAYLGFLVYQLEQEKSLDNTGIHTWIDELIRTLG